MSIAAKTGFIADFKTGYLQRAIILHKCAVTGGEDTAHDGLEGYAVGRLVKLVSKNGEPVLSRATSVNATSIGDATHIIAQSDDSLRNVPSDVIPVERYTTRGRNILGNTVAWNTDQNTTLGDIDNDNLSQWKSVAVYKIVDAEDIKIIPVKPATVSVTR